MPAALWVDASLKVSSGQLIDLFSLVAESAWAVQISIRELARLQASLPLATLSPCHTASLLDPACLAPPRRVCVPAPSRPSSLPGLMDRFEAQGLPAGCRNFTASAIAVP